MKWLLALVPAVVAGVIPVSPIELGDAPPPGQVIMMLLSTLLLLMYPRSPSAVSPMAAPDALRAP